MAGDVNAYTEVVEEEAFVATEEVVVDSTDGMAWEGEVSAMRHEGQEGIGGTVAAGSAGALPDGREGSGRKDRGLGAAAEGNSKGAGVLPAGCSERVPAATGHSFLY